MKGIILAGGSGSRLYPLTKVISKQLLPVYDKPMIYYPLSTLMLSGINEILIISTPTDISLYERLFNDGSNLGLKISYKVQPSPDGLAQAFILGEAFIGDDNVALVLGDNIFYGTGFIELLKKSVKTVTDQNKAVVFGYEVKDPNRYGVVEFNKNKEVLSIEEKPENPKSNYAVVGLYYYTNDVIEIAKNIEPSNRGELEITSVNNTYLEQNKLNVELMGRGFAWLDTGTIDAINNASNFIRTIEERQGLKVACLEEIAYQNNFINKNQLDDIIKKLPNDNANYLRRLIDN
jgi:glucose-1-phosphate thymidylyltransferase